MEFQFSFDNILPGTFNRVTGPSFDVECWDEDGNFIKQFRPHVGWLTYMKDVIDTAGKASAKAQGLPSAITTFERVQNLEHTLYIVAQKGSSRNQNFLLGLLKVGRKKLFLLDGEGYQNEATPLCVLDFYVPEAVQRRGHGKTLFEFMLKLEKVHPYHLAIDRPSDKFLALLDKHFGLNQIIPQVINYVIFAKFFEDRDDHVEKKTKDKWYAPSPKNSPSVGRKEYVTSANQIQGPTAGPGGVIYLPTAAKQKSSLAQILMHDHLEDSLGRRANASTRADNPSRSVSSSHGEPSHPNAYPAVPAGVKPAAGLVGGGINFSSVLNSQHNLTDGSASFVSSAAKKDAKYSHSRLW